ncbi:hypothetical protein BGW38_006465 [Lunasporangiospora selenospora]|uniref:Uncharacterized protein n=1 Tax=Lunasporangiospora selenospora TaxID=979761 RepID=A0A9P6FZS2_9FUNG|nr:hypothetical protein BGW38_006465 [Lunasporangiospora selenospora]
MKTLHPYGACTLSLLAAILGLLQGMDAQPSPGPLLVSQTIAILKDELYMHGGSRSDSFLEANCTADLWRLRLGRTAAWNLSESNWEAVPRSEAKWTIPLPVSGKGLRTIGIPANLSEVDSDSQEDSTQGKRTRLPTESISPFMIEFGRSGCADEAEQLLPGQTPPQPRIGFTIFNPIMNDWDSVDLLNATASGVDLGFDANETLGAGDWLSPTIAVDTMELAWYIILQSSTPLRQVILRKGLANLTKEMEKIDLTESSSTLFPTQLLLQDWEVHSALNETAPFVGKAVATMVRDQIVIISGTANSFTPGDADLNELRPCDHAYVYSTKTRAWSRQNLVVEDGGAMPDTREKAAFIAVDEKIYMSGGVKPYQTVLNDLWILDTTTWTWKRGPDGPGPRADHSLLLYHEYLLAISGFDKGRNVPVTSVLPILAFNMNSSIWTDTLRATLDTPSNYVSHVARIVIIVGTVIVGSGLLVMALSTHLLRKWNQRNYTKVEEDYQLEDQRRRTSQQELPSILKKGLSGDGTGGGRGKTESMGVRSPIKKSVRGLEAEVIFEAIGDDYEDDSEEDEEERHPAGSGDHGDNSIQKVSLLSRPQASPSSFSPTTRSGHAGDHAVIFEAEDDYEDEDEDEDAPVIVRSTP